jgi:hypothetical protein
LDGLGAGLAAGESALVLGEETEDVERKFVVRRGNSSGDR